MLDELKKQYRSKRDTLRALVPYQILSEMEYFTLSTSFGQVFTAGIGAEAIRDVLIAMDVDTMMERLSAELDEADSLTKKKILKRIKFFQGVKNAAIDLD